MIRDSCPCGATITVERDWHADEKDDHERWLTAHAACRERAASIEPRPLWPFSSKKAAS